MNTKSSQNTYEMYKFVNFTSKIFTCEFLRLGILMRYNDNNNDNNNNNKSLRRKHPSSTTRLLSSFCLGAIPDEFAKQKGLCSVPWPGRNGLHKTSHEIITTVNFIVN